MGYSSKLVLNLDPNPQLGPEKILLPTRINPLNHNLSHNQKMTPIKTVIDGGDLYHLRQPQSSHSKILKSRRRKTRSWLARILL
jgi:hypothetical protein